MTRYYFHTDDGRRHPDEHGAELPNLKAVQDLALTTLTEMADALSEQFWRDRRLRVVATDERGLTLLTLELSATLSPALPGLRLDKG